MDTVEVVPTHRHHWLIAEPHGPFSAAVCKHCAVERDFRNWLPDLDFLTSGEPGARGPSTPRWNGRAKAMRSPYAARPTG